jgi:cysteinyl-tRNA synthetase
MNDDFNTPITLSHLFEGVRIINSVNDLKETITEDDKNILVKMMHEMVYEVLGLKAEDTQDSSKLDGLMQMILQQRVEAKQRKDFATSDKIRDKLKEIGFDIKDGKDGTTYSVNN